MVESRGLRDRDDIVMGNQPRERERRRAGARVARDADQRRDASAGALRRTASTPSPASRHVRLRASTPLLDAALAPGGTAPGWRRRRCRARARRARRGRRRRNWRRPSARSCRRASGARTPRPSPRAARRRASAIDTGRAGRSPGARGCFSHAAMAEFRPAWCGYTLDTTKMRSRRPAIASPTTSSLPPSAYISAVSTSVRPRSNPRRSAAISAARAGGTLAQAPGAEAERRDARAVGQLDDGKVRHGESVTHGRRRRSLTIDSCPRENCPMVPDADHGGRRIVRGACPHDCPDTCAMLVTVEDGRASRSAAPTTIRRRRACCARRSAATSTAPTRRTACCTRCGASAARAPAGSSGSPGTMRSASIARALPRARRVAGGTARPSCPTRTRATWGCCSTGRWTGASSTGSARRCSTARSARPRARPAGSPSSAPRWAWTSRPASTAG